MDFQFISVHRTNPIKSTSAFSFHLRNLLQIFVCRLELDEVYTGLYRIRDSLVWQLLFIMASRAAMRGTGKFAKKIKPEDKHESERNEEDRHILSGDIDTIIIGAGFSGLMAARDLALKGFKVVIFESSHRIGGRCYSALFPETATYVDLGGEWFDIDKHKILVDEAKRYNLPIIVQNQDDGKYAYSFSYPGRKIITRAQIPEDYMDEYKRISMLINRHLGLFTFNDGFDERMVDFLDIPFMMYLKDTLGCKGLMLDFHLSMAFCLMGGDADNYSTLHVLHNLSGFGDVEEVTNTRPREGFPFENMHLARLDGGMSTLAERMADEIISLGGEIRLNQGIGKIVCEPIPDGPCPRYCPKCAIYTYAKCSLHGPRVKVVNGMGRETRGRALLLACPLKCIPAMKFEPELPVCIKHASEVCNIGECTKAYVLASKIGAAVDRVQSWPGPASSFLRSRFVKKLNKDITDYAAGGIRMNSEKAIDATADSKGQFTPPRRGRGDKDGAKYSGGSSNSDDDGGKSVSEYSEGTEETETDDDSTVMTAASSPSVRDGNTTSLNKKDAYTSLIQLAPQGEIRYEGSGDGDDRSIGTRTAESVPDEFDENGYKVRAYAILGTLGPIDEIGVKGQKLAPLLRKHHPTSRLHKILSHDWRNDRHSRGSWMCLRAGTADLFNVCIQKCKQPWEHTKNFLIIGSDVTDGWTGWMEGALQSGQDGASQMSVFYNPPVPEANFTGRYTVGEDPRTT